MADARSHRRKTFDALFSRDRDPWDFETSDYEREKRAATIAALKGARFDHSLEVGCATGVLTRELAPHCAQLLALDVSDEALDLARKRSTEQASGRYRRAEVPQDWPDGSFDLIVFSEILYFLSAHEVAAVSRQACAALAPGGLCLLVNWTGPNDLPLSGDAAVHLFVEAASWRSDEPRLAPSYRIDRLQRST
ncbi:SAM-dependent methyltransferase [Erythrobacter sp. R86502]|uniref:SAM-dependent methyltransferase n=1 Tax=Erythrobacter sp. R86502 TaxID=3093846 RepID=UPI0036D27BB4